MTGVLAKKIGESSKLFTNRKNFNFEKPSTVSLRSTLPPLHVTGIVKGNSCHTLCNLHCIALGKI